MVLWDMIVAIYQLPEEMMCCVSGSGLEWSAVVGESPVRENATAFSDRVPE